jgi:hypothetical protein
MAAYQARVLVVANQTADAPELVAALQARQERGPMVPTLLMPATRIGYSGKEEAGERLQAVLERWREAGLSAQGVVGDPDPAVAVHETWDPRSFDEVIVSTLPKKSSKWLRRDLIGRIERLGLPVTAITPEGEGMTNKGAVKTLLRFGAGPGGGGA